MMKKVALYLGILIFAIAGNLWVFRSDAVWEYRILITSCFGEPSLERGTALELTLKSAPFFYFQLLRTIICYEDLTRAGVYVFTRCPDRRKRTAAVIGKCALSGIVYTAIWQGTGIIMGIIVRSRIPDATFFLVYILQVLVMAGWMVFFTIIGFHVCIFFGSVPGVIAGLVPQFLLISSMELFSRGSVLSIFYGDTCFDHRNIELLKLHPFSQMVLEWQFTYEPARYGYPRAFPIYFVAPVFWLLAALAGVILVLSVNRMELYGSHTGS